MTVLTWPGSRPSTRRCAKRPLIDGANAWQTFWRVIFPVMRPINVVVMVVTVIESLRAFDLVYITNKGINGLELLSVLVTSNIVGETQRSASGRHSAWCCWSSPLSDLYVPVPHVPP